MRPPACLVVHDALEVRLVGRVSPSVLRTIFPGVRRRATADVCVVTPSVDDADLDPRKVNLLVSVLGTKQEYLDTPYGQKYGERQSPNVAAAFLGHLTEQVDRGLFGSCALHPIRTSPPSALDTALAAKGALFVHGAEYHAPYLRRRAANGDWGITSPSTTAFYSMFDNPQPVASADYHVFFCGEPHRVIPRWADVWVDCKLISGSPALYEPFWLTSMAERVNHIVDDINLPRDVDSRTGFCAFLYSNCVPWREALYYLLCRYRRVDALGRSPRRVTGGRSTGVRGSASFMDDAVEMYRPYRFVICCENTRIDGYITEKIVSARLAGCVPIYLGAPDWAKYINPAAVVDVSKPDFVTTVKSIDRDPQLRARMLKEPLIRPEIFAKYAKQGEICYPDDK